MTTPSDPLALLRSKSYLALLVLAAIIGVGGAMLELVLVPGLLAAGVGSLVFIGLDAWTGLGTFSLAIPGLPHVGSPTGVEFLWAVAIGVMAAPLGSGIRWLGLFLRPHVERRMLLVTPVAGLTVATAAAMVHLPLDGMPAPAWRDCLVLAPAEPSAVRTRPASITPLLLTGRNQHAVGMGGIPEFSAP
jgi:hypothetical protein